jgi:hypothetical protein
MENTEVNGFIEKYNSIVQVMFELIDTQIMIGELGRGSGKTTEIIGSRMVRMAYDMPGSTIGIAADTYVSLWQNILPYIMQYFRLYYKEGIHFVVGKRPPKWWTNKPFIPVENYNHTISTCWGTVFQLISADRIESALSKNLAHVIVDELLRIDQDRFLNRIFKAVRGNRQLFGHSHYFGGFTGFSSTPDPEIDETWFLDYENKTNPAIIQKILQIAWDLNTVKYNLHTGKITGSEAQMKSYVQQSVKKLRELRRDQIYYHRASSLSNIKILGWDYIRTQFDASVEKEIFDMAVLGIRKTKVKNMFFGTFGKQNIFNDSYTYRQTGSGAYMIDKLEIGQPYDKTASDLKHYDRDKPLILGVDWGGFMSMVVAQRYGNNKREMRILKNFYVWTPEQHAELAAKFNKFFASHNKKRWLVMHYDRAGNNKRTMKDNSSVTDAKIFKAELEKLGWNVTLMSATQRVIFHWEHYKLCHILFEGKTQGPEKILICQNECEELISSINHSPVKKSEGIIELDKSSERKLPFEQQPRYSTQLATAMTYMLFGEYEKYLTKAKTELGDYEISVM